MLRVAVHLPSPRGDGGCAAGSWRFADHKSKQLRFCKQALGMAGCRLFAGGCPQVGPSWERRRSHVPGSTKPVLPSEHTAHHSSKFPGGSKEAVMQSVRHLVKSASTFIHLCTLLFKAKPKKTKNKTSFYKVTEEGTQRIKGSSQAAF